MARTRFPRPALIAALCTCTALAVPLAAQAPAPAPAPAPAGPSAPADALIQGVPGFLQLTPAQLGAIERDLRTRLNDVKQAARQLADYGTATAWVAHREADGLAEIHQDWADLVFVSSGEARLLVGGQIADPFTDAPGEIRGQQVIGGEIRQLRAGDVVHVPAGVQHRFLITPGGQITFFTMKIAPRR